MHEKRVLWCTLCNDFRLLISVELVSLYHDETWCCSLLKNNQNTMYLRVSQEETAYLFLSMTFLCHSGVSSSPSRSYHTVTPPQQPRIRTKKVRTHKVLPNSPLWQRSSDRPKSSYT
mmetsp:Transcript_3414/g.7520  ORF Transcript_3414/g.7520 Transcript_3414/m.7520 type:complete len:117 (-) Transcript_3414:872-1222(-)